MRHARLKLGPMENLVWLLGDEESGEAAVVDPGFEPERVVQEAEALGLRLTHVLVTHAHPDHVAAVPDLVRDTGARVAAHAESPLRPDLPLRDGDVLRVGGLEVRAHATPGHQPDHLCYEAGGRIYTGDLLFVGDCGRTDLAGSDPEAMWRSLLHTLASLPRSLVVCPGHDYGPTPESTLQREFAENPALRPRSREDFVRFMAEP